MGQFYITNRGQNTNNLCINRNIKAQKVRLIDENGNMIGVVEIAEALKLSEEKDLDLVEVSPQVTPPVCKILDYGKYKYKQQKKKAIARKKQKIIVTKEVNLRPMINGNDRNTKLKKIREFLNENCKVKVSIRFKGRELSHSEFGINLLEEIKEEVLDIAKIENIPKLEGRQIIMMLSPKVDQGK
ncbi:MAG: translation initiation factor IF-3 [Alphaproteobacteria bacterium]